MKRKPFNLAAYLWVTCVLATAGWFGWQMAPEPAKAVTALPLQGLVMPNCSGGKCVTCVVDGGTIWVQGEKIRLEGFNTPEMSGDCNYESELARKA